MHTLKLILISFLLLVLIDAIWLGWLMGKFYRDELGSLAKRSGNEFSPNLFASFVTYLFILGGLYAFPFQNAIQTNYIEGFMWGLVVYGVYEFTNLAVIKNWSLRLVCIDLLWGACLGGIMTIIMKALHRYV